jgi:hypothetical protein
MAVAIYHQGDTKRMANEKERRAKLDDAETELISSVLGGENR